MDEEVTLPPVPPPAAKSAKCDVLPSATLNPTPQDNSESVQESHLPAKREPMTVNLPSRKQTNVRKLCIQAVKTLHDELFIASDKDVLQKTYKMITDIIDFTKKHHPNQNGITLKDKSLSPKKLKNKSKLKNISQLSKRKKKNYFTKRVGTVADSVNAKVQIDERGS